MRDFKVQDENYEQRVRESFARQKVMDFLGAEMTEVTPGACEIRLPYHDGLSQQHGFFHGGIVGTIADSAAGYAALSLYPKGTGVLTTEFKLNLLNPGRGERLVARGRVVKPGRTLTVCRGDVYGIEADRETHVATGLFSMICLEGLDD